GEALAGSECESEHHQGNERGAPKKPSHHDPFSRFFSLRKGRLSQPPVSSNVSAASGSSSGTSGSGEKNPSPASSFGNVSRKFEPWPGFDHTSSTPPCTVASSRAIARPSPVPPSVRFREGSARQNRSKTRATASSFMPTPQSRTDTATAEPLESTLTSM